MFHATLALPLLGLNVCMQLRHKWASCRQGRVVFRHHVSLLSSITSGFPLSSCEHSRHESGPEEKGPACASALTADRSERSETSPPPGNGKRIFRRLSLHSHCLYMLRDMLQ